MFKSKSSSNANTPKSDKKKNGAASSANNASASANTTTSANSSETLPNPDPDIEVGKEAKEKKDKSSWVKTIGIRTLRMRRNGENRSSRLSIPSFSSLDRPGKGKKGKEKAEDKDKHELDLSRLKESSNSPSLPVRNSNDVNVNSSDHVRIASDIRPLNNEVTGGSHASGSGIAGNKGETASTSTAGETTDDKHDPARFLGEGLTFRGKLIGVLEVSGPRGDRICQEALSDLKMAVKAAGEHKQKVTVHVALDGLRIRDEKTGDCLYHHQVHKISFIAQDLTDTRAFGYIFGSPDTGHRFFGIKTEKSASQVVISMRDLFQVVFDLKKKEIEKAKQQLEMQQKFLATRAAESAPLSSTKKSAESKHPIAETYIEGACALGAHHSSIPPPNRVAPEVDLLNLEVELTSLQEGLESIHHNLSEVMPFRGSTSSITSDHTNPTPKRPSVSSSHASNTTPIPNAFGSFADPFGDSFVDPFTETSPHPPTNFQVGASSKFGSALTSPFPADPFAQVDPFPGHKFHGDSEFFNSDPFESPSGPFSFSFPAPDGTNTELGRKLSDSKVRNESPQPSQPKHNDGRQPEVTPRSRDSWAASFEDNFVPESSGPASRTMGKPDLDIFLELDPLSGSSKPKHAHEDAKQPRKFDLNSESGIGLSNSFSSNFTPATNASEFELKSFPSLNRSESPPNYSPPPPPRISSSSSPAPGTQNNNKVPYILPPATNSPRLGKKKSQQILKQITISEASSSPKTLPKLTARVGKQFTLDSSFSEEVPNLSPPPRPPHSTHQPVPVSSSSKPGTMSSVVPRPVSGTLDKRKISGNLGTSSGGPPEPPPRPLQTTPSASSYPMQLVSPPPPLPPKKNTLSNTMSTPYGMKQDAKRSMSTTSHTRTSYSESNDLPLPLPLRKLHPNKGGGEASSALEGSGGRYSFPESNMPVSGSPILQRSSTASVQAQKMSMDQALAQVASMSLGDLATKLELPVEHLSSFTIQQLAQKLTQMGLTNNKARRSEMSESFSTAPRTSNYGFDDDFSTSSAASAPPQMTTQKNSNFDRYAVFRELAVEDASGFSLANNVGSQSFEKNFSDDERSTTTLEKPFTSRESSSERTLQADDEPISHLKSASFATAMANTMDDVTDVNLSDDPENSKYMMDDEDDTDAGFMKSEWATFESNFDDHATTALVKAEDGNESPWESAEEGESKKLSSSSPRPLEVRDQFDFKPFEKPAELVVLPNAEENRRKHSNGDSTRPTNKGIHSPMKSPTNQFQRQSSGSSRHSERSSGGNNPPPGKMSDYSDSGRPEKRRHHRRNSKDYERWEIDRDREGSGRYRDRDYEVRSDSRNSYTSVPRKYRNGDSEEEFAGNSIRRGKVRPLGSASSGRRRSKDLEREEELEDDDDDRSYASHHSNYSSGGYSRRYRRYPSGKHYSYSRSGRRGRERGGSPDRYSHQESDDESVEDEGYPRKRDRENYAREREYHERHHRPRPNSGSSTTGKRYSPRHSGDSYHRRDRRRYSRDEEEHGDSRELSDYSGEDDHPSHSHSHYGSHRRRTKRYQYRDKDRDVREPRRHYYTNSPSWDSESYPEGEPENDAKDAKTSRRSNTGRDRLPPEERHRSRGSPEQYSARHQEKESNSRRYQSELALNSKDSPKLSAINFEDDFGASSLPPEAPKSRNPSITSPIREKGQPQQDLMDMTAETQVKAGMDARPNQSQSPFGDDFIGSQEQSLSLTSEATMNNGSKEELDNNESYESAASQLNDAGSSPSAKLDGDVGDGANASTNASPSLRNGIVENKAENSPQMINDAKAFSYTGRRLESIKSEEEKSNDDSHSQSQNSEILMKKSDSFNIFKQRADDPFADDDFFA